jgi:hypothetical protein
MNSSAHLMSDKSFVTLQEQDLGYAYRYTTAIIPDKLDRTNFGKECVVSQTGPCRQFAVNSKTVDDYERVIPGFKGYTRNGIRSTSTELVGVPFKARGDGALYNPNALSDLLTPTSGWRPKCAKPLSEVTYDAPFTCMGAPLAFEGKNWGGVDSRQGIQYLQNC